jgi:8-oxo-dGTP diphosphatase
MKEDAPAVVELVRDRLKEASRRKDCARHRTTSSTSHRRLPAEDLRPVKGGNAADVTWAPVDAALGQRDMAFDHADLLEAAVSRLRSKVEYTSLPAYLLPEPFTLPQLQRKYEVILGRPVDKSGFRTRTLAADFLDEVGVVEGESNRSAVAYRLRDRDVVVTFPRTFSPRT